jgi:hypothetical protein
VNENPLLAYALSLVIQSGIIMGVSYWITGSLVTSAYIAGGIAVATVVLPYAVSLVVGAIVIAIAWIVSFVHPPSLEATNVYRHQPGTERQRANA